MTNHDNSFTADGPNVYAFDNGPNFSVGVNVVGKEAGVVGRWIPGGTVPPTEGFGVRGYGQTGVEGTSLDEEIGRGPGVGVVGKGYVGVAGKGRSGGPGGRFEAESTMHGQPGPPIELVAAKVPQRDVTTYPAAPEELGGHRASRSTVIGLPYEGTVGQLLTLDIQPDDGEENPLPTFAGVTLWLCVAAQREASENARFPSIWRQVLLGSPVSGELIRP